MKNCAPDGAQFLNVRISSALLVLLQQHGHALGARSAAEDEHRAERLQRLHYSQPDVSRMIADLEQEWGVTLLERGKAGVVLTGDGARLSPHARALCAEYARLSAEVDALPGQTHVSAATRQFLRIWTGGMRRKPPLAARDLTIRRDLCIITTKSLIFCEICPPASGDREESNVTYTVDDKMKTLLAAPEAVAVLERFFPKILKNPALQMTAAMTLRQVAGFAQSGLTADSLAEIDAQLRALPSSDA